MHDEEEEVPPLTTTTPAVPPALDSPDPGNGAQARVGFVEAIFDNLSFWAVISAAIGLLYLVWATLEILSRYVGHVPSMAP
ncbi:MAG TPA: hypothetical protein VIL98_15560 [Gaiellaceae bacterium]